MAKDGYVPLDGNAGDLAVGEQSVAGGSGGAVLSNDFIGSDTIVGIPADGNGHNETPTFAAPPAWLQAGGLIVDAGLYVVWATIGIDAAFTDPTKLVSIQMPFRAMQVVSAAALVLLPGLVIVDVETLLLGDTPFGLTSSIKAEADITGTLTIAHSIMRLAH